MSSIHVADDTFVAASPDLVARQFQDRADWSRWWPDLSVTVQENRGDKGVRWRVGDSLDGTMEVWLEPVLDGTMIHYFLHAEPARQTPLTFPELAQANRAWRVTGRAMAFEVKFRAEQGRRPGEPAVSSATSG
nr:polyketide cyclase / dehydrase and lipid transport [Hoyosella subflava]